MPVAPMLRPSATIFSTSFRAWRSCPFAPVMTLINVSALFSSCCNTGYQSGAIYKVLLVVSICDLPDVINC